MRPLHRETGTAPTPPVFRALREVWETLLRQRLPMLGFWVGLLSLVVSGLILCPRESISESRLLVRIGRESVTLDPTATVGPIMGVQESRENEITPLLDLLQSRSIPESVVATLLAAGSLLPTTTPLLICGDGPLAARVQEVAGRDPRIRWLGQRPWEETLVLQREARGLVMPSIWYETFGRRVIEAFATGTPVVASRLGAMGELVVDGRTGLLFEPGSPQALRDCVYRLADSPPHTASLREAARAEYLERCTADANYPQLIEIYERALAIRHGNTRPRYPHALAGACQ